MTFQPSLPYPLDESTNIFMRPAIPFDLSAKDAFDDNEVSYMVIFQGKKDKQVFLLDFMYSDTQSDEDVVPVIDLEVRSTAKNTVASAAYLHEIHNGGGTVVDIFGGLRYWDVDSTLKFKGGFGLLAGEKI